MYAIRSASNECSVKMILLNTLYFIMSFYLTQLKLAFLVGMPVKMRFTCVFYLYIMHGKKVMYILNCSRVTFSRNNIIQQYTIDKCHFTMCKGSSKMSIACFICCIYNLMEN